MSAYQFKRLGPNYAATAEFSVRRVDRSTLRYAEANRILDIEVEIGDGLAIYVSCIRGWHSPADTAPIDPGKQQEIVERVCAALDFLDPTYKYVLA